MAGRDAQSVPYYGVMKDRTWRQALRKVAADEGLTVSAFIHKAVRAARPDIDEIAARFAALETAPAADDDH